MLRTQFTEQLKAALRDKDNTAISTIRLIMAALKDRDIAERAKGHAEEIDDTAILSMLQSMIKQRHESIKMYEQGGRTELAAREKDEITVIEKFLPAQMSEDDIIAAIEEIKAELGATSIRDMGGVMKELKDRFAGQMDMGKASNLVKGQLS